MMIIIKKEYDNYHKLDENNTNFINNANIDYKEENNIAKENTRVFNGIENANNVIINFVHNTKNRIDACLDANGPSVVIDVKAIK